MSTSISLTLKIWRQKNPADKGRFETYTAKDISTDMSFLEMLDVVNEQLTLAGQEPVAFDHDCREGICGSCGTMVNGRAHGQLKGTTLCQLHMRHFKDGDTIVIEPFRARAFPVIKDLVVDRSAFDHIIQAGGFISVNTGSAPRGQHAPGPAPQRREGHGRCRLHRLRGLCRRLPQCLGHAVRERQNLPVRTPAPGTARSRPARPRHGPGHGRMRVRELLQPPGMRKRLPEGDRHRQYRPAEPRVCQGEFRIIGELMGA